MGGGGDDGAMAPPDFERSVNPIPDKEGQIKPNTFLLFPPPSRFLDILTALKHKMKVAIEGKTFYNVSLLGSEPFIVVSLL